jgi:hypothetical protein
VTRGESQVDTGRNNETVTATHVVESDARGDPWRDRVDVGEERPAVNGRLQDHPSEVLEVLEDRSSGY